MYTSTRTIDYGWQDFSERYTVKCRECQKELTRTLTTGCNRQADREYIKNLRDKLEIDAEKESGKLITCDPCLKKRLDKRSTGVPINSDEIQALEKLSVAFTCAERARKEYVFELKEKYAGRIVIVAEEEWVVDCFFECRVYCYRVNKRKPWLCTETQDRFNLEEILVTEETLEQRQEQVK